MDKMRVFFRDRNGVLAAGAIIVGLFVISCEARLIFGIGRWYW